MAQSSRVEVNLEVLEDYTPPPMFEQKEGKSPILLKAPITVNPVTVRPKKSAIDIANEQEAEEKHRQEDAMLLTHIVPIPRAKPYEKLKEPRLEPRAKLKDMHASGQDGIEQITPEALNPARDITEPVTGHLQEKTAGAAQQEIRKQNVIMLGFLPGIEVLSEEIKPQLLQRLGEQLEKTPNARIEIQAYASDPEDQGASGARRLSLARALDIRNFMIENNIDAAMIDVRAFGFNPRKSPPDRVEIYFNAP